MKLKLITPEKIVIEKKVTSVTLPGSAGEFTVLPGHDRMITPLNSGPLFFRYNDSENKECREDYPIETGSAEVLKDTVTVFVKSALDVKLV